MHRWTNKYGKKEEEIFTILKSDLKDPSEELIKRQMKMVA